MKKLLYVTAFPPNRRSGGQTFSLNAIKDLQSKYEVSIIYYSYNGHELGDIKSATILKTESPSLFNCIKIPWVFPLFSRRYSRKMCKYIKKIAFQYDVLYFDFSQCALYSLYINHPIKIIRCHDIIYQKYLRSHPILAHWVKRSEKKILSSAKIVLTPSKKDCQLIQNVYNLKSDYTHEYLENFTKENLISYENYRGYILFGLWSRKENLKGLIWLVKNVIPFLTPEMVSQIVIMGGGLEQEYIEKYLKPYNIKYLGYIENQYEEIKKYRAMIVPLFEGAGIKVKVLDSFLTGTPVIGTDVAFEGIEYIDSMMIRCNTASEFIYAIEKDNNLIDKYNNHKRFVELYNNRHLTDFI